MKKTVVLVVGIFFLQINLAWAQIKIDVKTDFDVKRELAVVKAGIIGALENSRRYDKVEVGEDYSLWITGVYAKRLSNKIALNVNLQLRTPAFITEGDLIKKIYIHETFNPKELKDVYNTTQLANRLKTSENLYLKAFGLIAKAGGVFVTVQSGLSASAVIKNVLDKIHSVLIQWIHPTKAKLRRAMFIGAETVKELDNYFYY